MLHAFLLALGVFGVLPAGDPSLVESEGPFSRLYLQDAGSRWMFTVQGNEGQPFYYNGGNNQSPIAVADTIRTTGGLTNRPGFEISLSGTLIQQLPENGYWQGQFWDGTTDGQYNYAVDPQYDLVLRFERDWTNPITMFTVPGFLGVGITWNPNSDTFWIVGQEDFIHHYTRQGQLLSSFRAHAGAQPGHHPLTFLAYDPADGTLWVGRQTFQGYIHNYKPDGEYLGTAYYPALNTTNTLGGEFQVIPGPGTAAAALVLLTITAARRPRRR